MTAAEFLPHLAGVRVRGREDRWIARCPAHDDTSPSLTIRETADRILIRCWAGCAAANICSALGITLADLYHDRRRRPDPVSARRLRAAEALESWRQSEIRRCAEDLRIRDVIILQVDRALRDCVLTEDEAMVSLGHEYNGYSNLEYRFCRLLRDEDTLQMWREARAS